jgi:hypothetical protein
VKMKRKRVNDASFALMDAVNVAFRRKFHQRITELSHLHRDGVRNEFLRRK